MEICPREEEILINEMLISGDVLLIPLSRRISTANSREADALLLRRTSVCGLDGRAVYMFIGLTTKELAGIGTEATMIMFEAHERAGDEIRRILEPALQKVGVVFSTMKYVYDPNQAVRDLMQLRRGTLIGEGVSSLETRRTDGTPIIVLNRAAVVSDKGEDMSDLRVVTGAYTRPNPAGGKQLLRPISLSREERAVIDRRLGNAVWRDKPPALEARVFKII